MAGDSERTLFGGVPGEAAKRHKDETREAIIGAVESALRLYRLGLSGLRVEIYNDRPQDAVAVQVSENGIRYLRYALTSRVVRNGSSDADTAARIYAMWRHRE